MLISQSLHSQYDVNQAPTEWKNPDMIVHNDRPWNIETPVYLLDDEVTPIENMFVRNNGIVPTDLDPEKWTLTIEGESVPNPKTYTLNELKNNFKHYSYNLVLECGGNGRSEMNPPASGNQWGYGAVNCGRWTGVRLKDLLEDVGITDDAVYVGYYGTDKHLSGDPKKVVISRGVPIEKAMQEETLVAFQLNGEDIPIVHGYPLRLVVGGWPASGHKAGGRDSSAQQLCRGSRPASRRQPERHHERRTAHVSNRRAGPGTRISLRHRSGGNHPRRRAFRGDLDDPRRAVGRL